MGITVTIRTPAEGLISQGKKSVEPILRTENLWKLYRSGKVEVPALRGVNFEVQPGESVAVMGPSGCGKSSLLYVIGGVGQASPGKNLLGGNDFTRSGENTAELQSPLQLVCRLFLLKKKKTETQ